MSNIPSHHWTVDDVHKYISNLHIGVFKYNDCADMFRKEIINGRLLLNLEKDDLNVLGIHQFAKRNALYEHLQGLKRTNSTLSLLSSSPTASVRNNSTNSSIPDQNPAARLSPRNKNAAIGANTTSMTPLVLPSPSPVASNTATQEITSNDATIKVLPSNPMSDAQNYREYNPMRASTTSIASLPSVRNTSSFGGFPSLINPFNSPIYRSSFPQITSPPHTQSTPFSPNFIPNAINSNHNILPIGMLSPHKPNISFQGLQLNPNPIANLNINPIDDRTISLNTTVTTPLNPTPSTEKEESVHTHVRRLPNEEHIVDIPAIYQGVNSHNTVFLLLTQGNILELNEMYKQLNVSNDNDGAIKSRNIFSPLQHFRCSIETQKVQYGWQLRLNGKKTTKLPFNPLIRFKLNVLTDEIVGICPIMVTGHVNHINSYGQAWISSDLQIDAIEEVSAIPSALISNIISLKLTNISHKSLQQRDASYMIHDPERYHNYHWRKGLRITFCLKLSTRTNKKNNNTRKPVFVQSWNVKPL